MNTKRIALVSILLTLALIIGIIESLIPPLIPIFPYIRVGFSNIIVLYTLITMQVKDAYLVAILKSIFVGIFVGNPIMILYSLPSSVISLSIAYLIISFKKNSLPAISAISAIAHNITQLVVAALIMQTLLVLSYVPYFILIGSISGFGVGCIVYLLLKKMPKFTI